MPEAAADHVRGAWIGFDDDFEVIPALEQGEAPAEVVVQIEEPRRIPGLSLKVLTLRKKIFG